MIKNFNHQPHKVTKPKTIFPTDDALFKLLYLVMIDATKNRLVKHNTSGLLESRFTYILQIISEDLY